MGRKALRSWRLLWVPVAVAIALTVAACGGGSSGGDATGSSSPAARALTGTAATGGPVAGTVTLKDSSPAGNRRTTATASDGSYAFDVSGLTAPFMLRVTYGDPASPSALYSFSTGPGTANITPLTSVAARAAVRGASLADFFETAGASDLAAAGSRMDAAVASLQSKLGPLTGRFAVQGNLLTARFTADHTGVDSLLDSVAVDFARAEMTVVAKSSGALLFFCPPADIGAGTFVTANMDLLTASSPTTGDAQYAAYCAGCHGALSATAKRGVTIARLQSAIANDNGKMGFLSMLSPGQMQSIVDALAMPTTPSQPDGAALYAAACAACHGELSASAKKGATTVRIQNAISGNVGSMGRFASLSAAEIQAIASALASTTAPPSPAPDGPTLYASNCAGCHGQLAASTKQGVSIARLQLAISSDVGGMGYLSRLSVDEIQAIVTALTPGTPTPSPVTPDGPSLYSSNCAGCHGALGSSTKGGASVERIQGAITGDVGGMGPLSRLTAAEIQAIAKALASVAPPVITDGPTLYATYCASCHGALGSSTKGGATAARIQAAISGNVGGMGSLSTMSAAQVTAIADALASVAPPVITDGPTLYATYCASCHGALGSSTKGGASAASIQAAISGNVGGMGSLSSLSAAQVTAIADALASVAPPVITDGPTLYATYCASCHGSLGNSTKGGASAASIQAAIGGNIGGMGSLSSLSSTQVSAIANALASVAPPVITDGPTLYATYCASCHGPLASSTKGGASAAGIEAAIGANIGGMGSLSTLSAAQVTAIANALASVAPPVITDGPTLYGTYCATCHGVLASSTKGGASASSIQAAISGNVGGMGSLSTLSAAQVTAIANALASVAPPVITDGPTLYATYCASCHGALGSSTKGGASASSIRAAISANTGGMGSLSSLSSTQVSAIASALATIPPTSAPCGSCHAIPPSSGEHGEHKRLSCANCHGVGYSSSSVNAATHNNGGVDLSSTIGWTSASKTCSNSCHGKKSWIESDD